VSLSVGILVPLSGSRYNDFLFFCHQFPMVDQPVGQVADLVEVLVEALVVDRVEEDRVEVDPKEGHVHPVKGLEQVVQACGVE
jgi:hypothetical protein